MTDGLNDPINMKFGSAEVRCKDDVSGSLFDFKVLDVFI
jgi:hypothetical protein